MQVDNSYQAQQQPQQTEYASVAPPPLAPVFASDMPQQPNPMAVAQLQAMQLRATLQRRVKSSAGWFFWIAGLSVINTFIAISGGGLAFVTGLGMTRFVDGISTDPSNPDATLPVLGLIITVSMAGAFALLGFFARNGHSWAFVVGMVVYAMDAAILLALGSMLGFGFHLLALFYIFMGLRANLQLASLEQPAPSVGSVLR